MKRLIIASMLAAGMLVTPMLATGAWASGATNTQDNPNASCLAGFATTGPQGAGLAGNPHSLWFAPTPYGQIVKIYAQIPIGSC
jgi:hypothetical protein